MIGGRELKTARESAAAELIRPACIFRWLAALFLLNLCLRLFYLRYQFVNGDETVRALTAASLLDGARLYLGIVTDKPPGATFFYAAVFALFGRSMQAVHIAAAIWNFATAMILYWTAARGYGKRAGLWAALLFVYFSTNYHTQDMMAANTELLMLLPYAASFYFFMRAATPSKRASVSCLFVAGLLTGVAILFKQVGVFNLAFFALYEAFSIYDARRRTGAIIRIELRRSAARLFFTALGVSVVLAVFALWLVAEGSAAAFWRNTVVLGKYYVDAMPVELWLKLMTSRVLAYILFNAALWSLAVWAAARAIKGRLKNGGAQSETRGFTLAIALWGAASLAAVFTGGRFFGHYFIQVLPALALLASRAVEVLIDRLGDPRRAQKARAALAALVVLSLFGFVRFHGRTLVLVYETLTGRSTERSARWGMTVREREAEEVAARLQGRVGAGEPLYIWGYAGDVYWRTGARPASRYLTPYYITGQFSEELPSVEKAGDSFWQENRAHLIEDLKRTRPRLILDVYGGLLSLPYAELTEFIEENYHREGRIGPDPNRPFVVFRRKEEN